MESGLKNKISLLFCFICIFLIQPVALHGKDEAVNAKEYVEDISREDPVRNTVKRSTDWSKRLDESDKTEIPSHVAEESEKVEVASKGPRIIRRMRILHGRQQNVELFKEINPQSRSPEGVTKIVRIKKFKRKPAKKTTIAPEPTSVAFSATTSAGDSTLTSSSPYSHITVFNKEVRNPKKKRNKKKRLNNQYFPTPSYDSEPKLHSFMYVTAFPDASQRPVSQQGVSKFDAPNSYPEYGRFHSEKKQPFLSKGQNGFITRKQYTNIQDTPRVNSNNYDFQPEIPKVSQPLRNFKDMDDLNYQTNSMIRKQSAPKPSFEAFSKENAQQLKSESSNEHSQNVSLHVDKIEDSSKEVKAEMNSTVDNKTSAEVTVQRAGEPPVTLPAVSNKTPDLLRLNNEKSNTSITRSPNVESLLPPENIAVPRDDKNLRQQQYRFPSRYPSLLYNRENAFADPFFDTTETPSAVRGTNQDMSYRLMTPLNLRFSPFYASSNPDNEDFLFDRGIPPYHSEDLSMPGFPYSPELSSLRRSIIDTYEGDTTTSEPVTPFSLPKFEMPPIDFSDKGCRTVYKEVKTVPSDGTENRNNNEKSFVMTRECYFPDGLPTTERTSEVETITVPNKTKISKRRSKDMKIDSKESE